MDVLVLIASFLTPAILIAGWLVWRKNHIYYLEKKSSYFLAYIRRLSIEQKLIKTSTTSSNLKGIDFTKRNQEEIDDLIVLLNKDAIDNAEAIERIFRKAKKSRGRKKKIASVKQRIKDFVKEQSSDEEQPDNDNTGESSDTETK